jgi:hypothetical protein
MQVYQITLILFKLNNDNKIQMIFTVKNHMWIIESMYIRVDLTFPVLRYLRSLRIMVSNT